MKQKIFDDFTTSNNHLIWYKRDLVEFAEKYGTPLIIYSKQKIISNFSKINNSFRKMTDRYSINYAMKANSNASILSLLRETGSGVDASSYHEVMDAINSGFHPDSISYTANNASPRELNLVADMYVKMNFDSIGQFNSLGKHIPRSVSFRIKSEYGRGEFKGTTTSGQGAKFGELPEVAVAGYRKAKELGCEHFGIHIMTGSNVRDPDHFSRVAHDISRIAVHIADLSGVKFEYLDIGGGFGVPYKPDDNELDIDLTAEIIFNSISKEFSASGLDTPEIVMEPGRYIVANAGILLGTVHDVKCQEVNYVGTDIGMNILIRPALYGAYHHIVIANKINDEATFPCEITGQICENTDRIGREMTFPKPHPGDIVAVFNAGAYVRSMASNYNGRGLPQEVLFDERSDMVISSRESGYM
ncbi:MAG: diaminopimelate decarboxylase [Thermoplasmataceae archaeon]|jgi:diaminopimelate decarboxylase